MSQENMNASTNSEKDGGKGLSPLELSEKRRKDAQAALTPLQQENARLKAELAAANTQPTVEISPEKQQELNDLMTSDPEKWRTEMNALEKQTNDAKEEQLKNLTKQEQDKIDASNFFTDNPDIDKAVIRQVIPTAIQQKYEAGEISIGEVLTIGKKLLDGAPIASVLAPDSPNIGEVAGSDKPTEQSKQKQVEQDWSTAMI